MAPIRAPDRPLFRLAVAAVSIVSAIAGSVVLATRHSGESVTTRGVRATLPVSGHPGAVAAGRDALWIALSNTAERARELPLVHVDLAGDAVVGLPLYLGGQVTHLAHVGRRLVASVAKAGGTASADPTSIVAVDWRTGSTLARRDFSTPIGPLVRDRDNLWALQLSPPALLRFDVRTLGPNAKPLRLPTRSARALATGAGYLWVAAHDAGDVLRIDPVHRTIARVHLGGAPAGLLVASRRLWVADEGRGEVDRLDARTLEPAGARVRVGGKPFSLARAGRHLYVGDRARGTVTKIDLSSGAIAGPPIRVAPPAKGSPPLGLTPAGDSVWVSSYAAKTVTRVGDSGGTAESPATASATPNVLPLPLAGKVIASIRVPEQGGAFTVGEGAVWAMSDTTSTLMRIDPKRNAIVARIKLPPADGAAVGDGAVWLAHPQQGTVTRLDPQTNRVTATIHVGGQPAGLAVMPGAVWVGDASGPSVMRIDPARSRVVARIRVGPSSLCCSPHMGVAASQDAVWAALPYGRRIVRIDPRSEKVVGTVKLDFFPCGFVEAGATAVWSAGADCTEVVGRVDRHTGRVTAELAAPHAVGIALAFGSVWIASLASGDVDRVDPKTARAVARLHVGGWPVRVGVGFGSVWVNDDRGRVLRIEPRQ